MSVITRVLTPIARCYHYSEQVLKELNNNEGNKLLLGFFESHCFSNCFSEMQEMDKSLRKIKMMVAGEYI